MLMCLRGYTFVNETILVGVVGRFQTEAFGNFDFDHS